MVAAQRAISHRKGLIDDPYAEPLVRAVGLDVFTRALDGEIALRTSTPDSTCGGRPRGWRYEPATSIGFSPVPPEQAYAKR